MKALRLARLQAHIELKTLHMVDAKRRGLTMQQAEEEWEAERVRLQKWAAEVPEPDYP